MSTTNTETLAFIDATRKKYRFQTSRGLLTVEDLWDLNLTALDNIAVELDEKIQKAGRKSFIERRTASTTGVSAQLDIVKYIIETKQTETEIAKVKSEKDSQKAFLKSLLEKKKIESFEGLSMEEIQKQIAQLD